MYPLEILKIASVFGFMIVLLRFRVNLGLAMFGASGLLAILYRIDLITTLQVALSSSIAPATLFLMAALYLIMFLEKILSSRGLMRRMVDALKALVPDDRPVMALMPSLVGLLPSAGGAAFSAPLVEAVSRGYELSPARKSFINYWYRHMCEYVIPLYPGMLVAAAMLDVPVGIMIKSLFPSTIAGMLAGIPVAFKGVPRIQKHETNTTEDKRKALFDLLEGLGPIVMVVILVITLGLQLATSLAIVVLGLLVMYRYSLKSIVDLAKKALSLNILFLVLGLMIFKDMMEVSGAVETLAIFLQETGINPLILVFSLPFITGVLTGYSPACIALSYPLIINLLGSGTDAVRLGAMAYTVGFTGVMLTPVHLCLLLTVQYFKADIVKVIKMQLLPLLAPVAAVVLWNVLVIGRLW